MDSNHDNLQENEIYKLQTSQWSRMRHWTRKTITRTQLVHGRIEAATLLCRLVPGERPRRVVGIGPPCQRFSVARTSQDEHGIYIQI